jgi:class 3 adenylate cyclase
MECPRCRHENRPTATFCGECGGGLTRDACPRCATANPPGHRFCDGCGAVLRRRIPPPSPIVTPDHLADRIRRTGRALVGERKLVTVLFADVVHSMELIEGVDAEEWHRVLDRFFQILATGIHRFEGTINQFTGDGIMALFGAPIAHEDHARRGCHAALDLVGALGDYASTLAARGLAFSVRMGLNSGEVVLGRIGDDLRMEYTALGHTVGLAARVQQMAAPGTAWVTEHTARLVEGFFAMRDRGTPAMKGVSASVRVFELAGTGALRTRLDLSRRRGFSRLVGREAELARLWRLLEEALAADGRVVGVVGDAGVGKSRVCLEFVERCRAQGIAVHEAHCPAHGAAVPLLPIRELVRDCLALAPDAPDVPRAVGERLAAIGSSAADAPLVLELLGVPDPTAPARAASAPALARFVAGLVRRLAAAEPCVLLVDDVHWIDAASEAVLREIAAAAVGARVLVVTNFRPDHDPRWMDGPHCGRLPLAPLGPDASQALLGELLGPDPSLAGLLDVIGERTGGNPFFIEEVVQALAGSGSLAGRRGAYRLAAPVETLAIPATVQSLLSARIDRLGSEAKDVLQVAAVIGKQFDRALLRAVLNCDDHALGTPLATLEEAELLREVGGDTAGRYVFRHPLTQEVAYQGQLGDRRARLHGAVASALQTLMADRLGEHAALIAHHWRAAGMRYEAARWDRRAALRVASIQVRGSGRTPAPRPSS